MNKCVVAGLMGLAVGMYIGYSQEEALRIFAVNPEGKRKKL